MVDQIEHLSGAPNVLQTRGNLDLSAPILELHMEDGSVFRLLTSSLLPDSGPLDGIVFSFRSAVGDVTIPLIEERPEVRKRVVATGTVRLQKAAQEYEAELDERLATRTFDIERVAINRVVDEAPAVRT